MDRLTAERRNAFAEDLEALCEKHRIGILGTCSAEGIYGEITLYDMDHPEECGWLGLETAIEQTRKEIRDPEWWKKKDKP